MVSREEMRKMKINMTKKNRTIDTAKAIAPILSSRDVMANLEQIIIKTSSEKVDLDFKNVKFISRSAAYELLKLKERVFYKNKKQIRFVNLNQNVSQMLKIVAAQLAVEEKKIPEVKIKEEIIPCS